MKKEIDIVIEDELFKDKLSKFYNINKKKIISLAVIIIFIPIIFQLFVYVQNKNNEKLITEYLRAEILSEENLVESIRILNNLILSNNDTIVSLSVNKLIDINIKKKNYNLAIKKISELKHKFKNKELDDLIKIKKTLLLYDSLNEAEILNLIKIDQESDTFINIKKKLLYDFYIKNNQFIKANQILKKDK
ncbi:hypothetical protein HIMB114_00007150 [alpha proteobacterium HIMB114]|nr:hypothetical protein HIMB114_00007150 [alpha proteobacterium HIMB114]